jgi:hypothetical protein
LKNNQQIFILVFLALSFWLKSQNAGDTLLSKKIFDSQLNYYTFPELLQKQKPIILITNTNCGACVAYFVKHQKQFLFLFVTNSLSLLDLQSTIELHNVKPDKCYFMREEKSKVASVLSTSNPAPCILNPKNTGYTFFNYKQSDSLTNGFTLPIKKLMKQLR